MRWLTLMVLSIGLLSAPVHAASRNAEAEALALEAQDAVEAHCSDAVADDVTLAAESVATVSAVWAKVSSALESNRKVYLLYWRGVLGQCLNQDEKALNDLEDFLAARGSSTTWASLVEDAERRVRRLRRGTLRGAVGVRPSGVLVAGGVGSGIASGVLGGLAGWQWSVVEQARQDLYDGAHIGLGDLNSRLDEEAAAVAAHEGLVVAASVAGAATVGLLVSGAIADGQRPRLAVAPWWAPTRDGAKAVGVVVAGRW